MASANALSHTAELPGKSPAQVRSRPFSPIPSQKSICSHAPQFSGSDQHDAQEFLSFLLDGLHEDLNRVLMKPQIQVTPEREAELEKLPLQIASQQEWETYRGRNDSLIVDFFQGQFRNRMECLTCHKVCCNTVTRLLIWLLRYSFRRRQRITLSCICRYQSLLLVEAEWRYRLVWMP